MAGKSLRDGFKWVALPGGSVQASNRYDVSKEEDGRVVLQPPPPATGVVWISVITAEPPAGQTAGMGTIVQAQAEERGSAVQELADGRVVTVFDEAAEEAGQRLLVRTCQVGIEKSLAIFQVVVPEQDAKEAANRALLADLVGMAETFEPAERTELIETATGTVQTKVTSVEPAGEQKRRDFGPEERKQVEEFTAFADGLVGRYATFSKEITPRLLDTVFIRWMEDADREKADGESVSLAIGTVFGEHLRKKLGMKWVVVSDEAGEAWGLGHDSTTMLAFPIESVRKRVEARETNFLHGLAQAIESHFHSGRDGKEGG